MVASVHGPRWLVRVGTALLAVAACAHAGAAPFEALPLLDERGYIDVGALRRDVIAVEALSPSTDEDSCYPEGDPDAPPMTRQEAAREQREVAACATKARVEAVKFQSAKAAFNRAWMPKIKGAISKGDVVAEAIFLLCETTDILDRGDAATTCHPQRKAAAVKRLREIGFAPAFTPCDPGVSGWRRAFRFCTGGEGNWATDAFSQLRLNRNRALTPGFITWGRELYYAGSNSVYTGRRNIWPDARSMAAKDLEIDAILKREPRWSVFLLTRVGRHEWVPEGFQSTSGKLDSAWIGRYRLVRGAANWTDAFDSMTGVATISRLGDEFSITVESGASAPLADVKDCRLRYSGGLTYLPELTPTGKQSASNTALGYFYGGGTGGFWRDGEADVALAPLHPKMRYRQVLMQCDEGESDQTPRMRFLFLAGNTLIEFATESAGDTRRLSVRHFIRVQW